MSDTINPTNGGDSSGGGGASGGNTPVAFRDQLPEEIRSEASLQNINDLGSLAKSYVSAQKMLGSRVSIPNEKSTPAEWEAFYGKVGRPATIDEYKPSETVKLAEGVTLDENTLKEAKSVFHKLGLTTQQGRGVLDHYFNLINGAHETTIKAQEESRKQAEIELRSEFGDKTVAKIDIAKGVLRKFGTPEFAEYIEKSGLGNNVHFVKVLSSIGEAVLEDHARGSGSGMVISDAASALAEINNLKADSEFQKAFMNREHSGHKVAVERWYRLHQLAFPGKEKE